MTVLTRDEPGMSHFNLFTLVRHRRQDALGPWANDSDEQWSSEDLGHCLHLRTYDASLEQCHALVDHTLESGTLDIDDIEVEYALHPSPRRHWAYRDDRPFADASVRSPFSRNSAEVIEYWSFDSELRDQWLKVLESPPDGLPLNLKRLGFPINQRADRVGNLMIAGAEDAITCRMAAPRDQTLRLSGDGDDLLPGAYRATVWGSHSGNEVIRREIDVTRGQTVIELASDVDHIGFAIYRTVDGQCIDLMETFLIMEINFGIEVASGPTMHMHIQDGQHRANHTITPAGSTSMINVRSDDESAEVDKGIRRSWLERRLHEREAEARKERKLLRFQPDEFDKAVQHVVHLLRQESHRTEPIYLADPYFMPYLDERKEPHSNLVQLYLECFSATVGRPLQILCGQQKHVDTRPWWSAYPATLRNHVSVRTFLKREGHNPAKPKPGFHDRYLVTPEREIIMTHSFNGWHEGGVTFISLPYGVYRTEAENLWSMDLQSVAEPLLVQEIR